MAAGYEDASCLLYDLRGKRVVQTYQPHTNEIRSVRFSVHSYYLLTASYDKKVVMTSLSGTKFSKNSIISILFLSMHSGDLTKPLVLSNVAAHGDKIIQARWYVQHICLFLLYTLRCFRHPNEMSFVTTSADRTCIVWAPPLSALSALAHTP